MKTTVTHIHLSLPVRYDEEDIPNDFPLRTGDMWSALVNIDTGEIEGWPTGQAGKIVDMKVCDEGTYILYCNGQEIARRESEYVPHGVVPGKYGDYVTLKINEHGIITNWPKKPDVSAFFEE